MPAPRSLTVPAASSAHRLRRASQVLARADPLDGAPAALPVLPAHQRAHVDDPLALLPRDLGPVVGVRRVREVLVLLVLLLDRIDHVLEPDALAVAGERPLDGEL